MKNKDFLIAGLNIVAIFLCAMFVSLLPDAYPAFFGDWLCGGKCEGHAGCNYGSMSYHVRQWHWGFRHWLFFAMGVSLFLLNAVRIIKFMDK